MDKTSNIFVVFCLFPFVFIFVSLFFFVFGFSCDDDLIISSLSRYLTICEFTLYTDVFKFNVIERAIPHEIQCNQQRSANEVEQNVEKKYLFAEKVRMLRSVNHSILFKRFEELAVFLFFNLIAFGFYKIHKLFKKDIVPNVSVNKFAQTKSYKFYVGLM